MCLRSSSTLRSGLSRNKSTWCLEVKDVWESADAMERSMASTMALTERTTLSWMTERHDACSRVHLSRANCMRKSGGRTCLVSETGNKSKMLETNSSVSSTCLSHENVPRSVEWEGGEAGATLAAFALAKEEYLDHLIVLSDGSLLRTELFINLVADPLGLCFPLFSCGPFPWGLVGWGGGDDCERV